MQLILSNIAEVISFHIMVAAGGRQFEYSFMDYSPESSPDCENGPDNGFEFQEFSRESGISHS